MTDEELITQLRSMHWCVTTLDNGVGVSNSTVAAEAADRIKELKAELTEAAAALKEIFDGKNWRLGQKFDPNSGNFDLSTQRNAYIKIKGEQP